MVHTYTAFILVFYLVALNVFKEVKGLPTLAKLLTTSAECFLNASTCNTHMHFLS